MILPYWISGSLREGRTSKPFGIPPLHAGTIFSLGFLLVPRPCPITVYLESFAPSLVFSLATDQWVSVSDKVPALGLSQAT